MNTLVSTGLKIENLKCGGCVKTVTNTVNSIDGVSNVEVNLESETVTFSCEESRVDDLLKAVTEKLSIAGYPIEGQGNNWQKAKSYISCAKGKFS